MFFVKDFQFYFNPYFWRGNDRHVKIMFHVKHVGYFGVFLNRQTHKTQVQSFMDDYIKSDWSIFQGDKQQQVYETFEEIQTIWNKISSDCKDDIFLRMVNEFGRSYIYCKKKYNINIDNDYNNFIYRSINHFIKFLQMLYNNDNVIIEPYFYDGMYKDIYSEKKVIEPTNIFSSINRKTIEMFKLINANNLTSLFEGNFYPIIKQENGYITIKDDKDKTIIVRTDRGKIIPVYVENPK